MKELLFALLLLASLTAFACVDDDEDPAFEWEISCSIVDV